MTDYDVIVIGAGIGGLTAAALLARDGYRRYQQAGTPVSFWRYTRRRQGMVGGLPQRSWNSGLFSLGPRAAGVGNLWLVGDSTFPGQSTAPSHRAASVSITLFDEQIADCRLQIADYIKTICNLQSAICN